MDTYENMMNVMDRPPQKNAAYKQECLSTQLMDPLNSIHRTSGLESLLYMKILMNGGK